MDSHFIGIDLSRTQAAQLTPLQPKARKSIKLIPAGQMHITLHFLAQSHPDELVDALAAVQLPPFELSVDHVGSFAAPGDMTVLWAGVSAEPLHQLHRAVSDALSVTGFVPEQRDYVPHVTMAWCTSDTPTNVVDGFLAQAVTPLVVVATQFTLFRTVWFGKTPMYGVVKEFTLAK